LRFILIDRITRWEPGQGADAIKNVALSEDFFDDHFPLKPIMPGVLMLEGLAEVAGLVLEETIRIQQGRNVKALLSLVEKAKFRDFVKPGDQLTYRAEIESANEQGGMMRGWMCVGERKVGEARLLFTFHEIENPRLDERRNELLRFWLNELESSELWAGESHA
jgi:3-hydroxyacyl-[acyl-carrier-protein] dehydratase